MKIRTAAREAAFQYLYRSDKEISTPPTPEELERHFEHFHILPDARSFAQELICGTLSARTQLDQQIESVSAHWKLNRMPSVDRSILRLGLYELSHFSDIPLSVTLNEAVELAKKFGSEESPSFVNGILDRLAKLVKPTAVG